MARCVPRYRNTHIPEENSGCGLTAGMVDMGANAPAWAGRMRVRIVRRATTFMVQLAGLREWFV